MKRSKFNPDQISRILKEFDGGKSTEQISREHGVSKATLYKWRQRYGGLEASETEAFKRVGRRHRRSKRITQEWVDDYNHYRPHDSLNGMSPVMWKYGQQGPAVAPHTLLTTTTTSWINQKQILL